MKMCVRLADSFYLLFQCFWTSETVPGRLLENIWNKAEDQRGSETNLICSRLLIYLPGLKYGEARGPLEKWHGPPCAISIIYQQHQQLVSPEVRSWAAPDRAGGTVRQGRRYGPSGQAVRTVHHRTNHTCLSTLLQLSRAGCRVGSALYRPSASAHAVHLRGGINKS